MPLNAELTAGLTIGQARRSLADAFRRDDLDSPELDARLLTGYVLGLDHAALVSQSERRLDNEQIAKLHKLALRRLDREPVARILSVKEFWGLPLRITDATLVPRPETETVVEAALAAIDRGGSRARPLRVADLGTGTGALLIALLKELPNATGVGTDISLQALDTARGNAESLGFGARAEFIQRSFDQDLGQRFDLVVSNPPYIKSGEIAALAPEVQRDPRQALDGGADGLDCYRSIVRGASHWLNSEGHLVVELGVGQEADIVTLMHSAGLITGPARADLAGISRALTARVATMTP